MPNRTGFAEPPPQRGRASRRRRAARRHGPDWGPSRPRRRRLAARRSSLQDPSPACASRPAARPGSAPPPAAAQARRLLAPGSGASSATQPAHITRSTCAIDHHRLPVEGDGRDRARSRMGADPRQLASSSASVRELPAPPPRAHLDRLPCATRSSRAPRPPSSPRRHSAAAQRLSTVGPGRAGIRSLKCPALHPRRETVVSLLLMTSDSQTPDRDRQVLVPGGSSRRGRVRAALARYSVGQRAFISPPGQSRQSRAPDIYRRNHVSRQSAGRKWPRPNAGTETKRGGGRQLRPRANWQADRRQTRQRPLRPPRAARALARASLAEIASWCGIHR